MLSTLSSCWFFPPENMSRWNNKHPLPLPQAGEVKRSLSAKEKQSVMGRRDLDMRARVECRHQRRSNWEILSGHRISATPTPQKPSENWDECSSLFLLDSIQFSIPTSPIGMNVLLLLHCSHPTQSSSDHLKVRRERCLSPKAHNSCCHTSTENLQFSTNPDKKQSSLWKLKIKKTNNWRRREYACSQLKRSFWVATTLALNMKNKAKKGRKDASCSVRQKKNKVDSQVANSK